MGRVQNYCGVMPLKFFEMLANCARIDNVTGDVFVNTICYDVLCDDAESPIECQNGIIDAEAFCVANFFAVDSCGHLGFKIGVCEKLMDGPEQ